MASIDFTGQGVPQFPAFSTAPVTVSREVAPTPAPPAPRPPRAATSSRARRPEAAPAASSTVATPHSSSIPESGAAAPGLDPEEVYDQVMTRLRRDLIAELEQNGHLLRETL